MLKKVAIALISVVAAEEETDLMHISVSPAGQKVLAHDVNNVGSALKKMGNDKRNMKSMERQLRQWSKTPEYK